MAHITEPGEKKYWYGGGGWSKKLKHWLKLLAISTYKIDFAFDGSQIQTRGEVGQISTEPVEVVVVVGEAGGGGGGVYWAKFYMGRLCPEVKRLNLSYTFY